MAVVELFKALGDQSRLDMIEKLSTGNWHSISSISKGMEISRQGARKHLQILADAHLVVLEPQGRETAVRLDRDALDQGRKFILALEARWDTRLEALREYVEDR